MKLLYFAPVPWNSHPQRPHFMVRELASRLGVETLWVNPYPTRLPRFGDYRRLGTRPDLRPATGDITGLRVIDVPAWPIEPLPGGVTLNRELRWAGALDAIGAFADSTTIVGVGRPTALALHVLERQPRQYAFYDAMDDFPEFYRGRARAATARTEQSVAAHADLVIGSSPALCDKFVSSARDVMLVRNGCHGASLPAPLPPGERDPVIGFVGTIAAWFDWTVVARVAAACGEFRVRLIGPRMGAVGTRLPANVELLAAADHQTALDQMRRFAVGLIPFTVDRLTHAVDPIKYYEYRALGLPVVVTPFGEFGQATPQPGTFVVRRDRPIEDVLGAALQHVDTAEATAAVRAECDWADPCAPLVEWLSSRRAQEELGAHRADATHG